MLGARLSLPASPPCFVIKDFTIASSTGSFHVPYFLPIKSLGSLILFFFKEIIPDVLCSIIAATAVMPAPLDSLLAIESW